MYNTIIGSKRRQPKKRRDIDIEKVNQLMSRKRNRNHEGDREVVEEAREKSSDDDSDDDDDNNNETVGKMDDHKKPEVFQSKSDLEIVTWLVDHPDILRLANQMSEMNKTDESLVASSSSKITDVSIKST
jgi:hypothetical protein